MNDAKRMGTLPHVRFLAVLLAVLGFAGCATVQQPPAPSPEPEALPAFDREFRAAWIATVANIDWPSEPGLPTEQQKAEMVALLDRAVEMNLNAVILQVRPAADALYDSPHEPWSEFLTGAMGRAPEPYYDPLAFAVEEAHRRGLELHTWFNPYRAYHPSAESEISPDHISRTQPDVVREYGTHLWLDPGEPGASEHTLRVILDVVERYDVDGVHFDDYFYPYKAYAEDGDTEFPDSASWARAQAEGVTLSRDDWRRQNVDQLIERLYREIKSRKPHVMFGISPFGIWRPGYPEGISGFDAYSELYADARKWLRSGWVDYFTPQIYYRIAQHAQPYPVMLRWWIEQNVHGRHIWPGNFTSRAGSRGDRSWPVEEIPGQIYTTRAQPGASGNVHFSMRAFMRNPEGLVDELVAHPYAQPALVPATPWLDDVAPGRPSARLTLGTEGAVLEIEPPADDDLRVWAIRTRRGDEWTLRTASALQQRIVLDGIPEFVAVSAVDRMGNEGPAVSLDGPESAELRPTIIPHEDWEDSPRLGYAANADRRNIPPGESLTFGDLVLQLEEMYPGEPDSALVDLRVGSGRTLRTVREGEAFSWGGYRVAVLALNTTPGQLGGGLAELEVAEVSSLPDHIAASDEAGGADRRLRIPHEIRFLTLHHSGSSEPLTPEDDPVDKLRGLQSWGAEARNWWDVPYHFLIDLEGNIYEGRDYRYMGETNTTYNPRGHLLVSVIGNYNRQEATPAQVEAITDLMAWASAEFDIAPGEVYGHRDWADTSCPGEHLGKYLDDGTFTEDIIGRLRSAAEGIIR